MDAIEKAIRNAFEKGNPEDRAFREKVYRAAFAALDRALQANPGVTVETAINRRKAVQAKIAEIESEFLPAVSSAAPEIGPAVQAPAPSAGPAVQTPQPQGRVEPSVAVPAAGGRGNGQPHPIPVVPDIMPDATLPGPAPEATSEVSPDRDERRSRRRFPFTGLFLAATVIAAVGIGAWWAMQTGLFKVPDLNPPVPPPPAQEEDFTPGDNSGPPLKSGQTDETQDWITVFSPADPTQVSAPAGAQAEVMKDDSGSFLRVRSGGPDAMVAFSVGQGVLEQIAGKHAVFDILARSEEGKETQITVSCKFGSLGDCGRRRYAVPHERGEYLFDVQLPNKEPDAGGTIAINSDFDNQGKAVDIYEIRVSLSE